MPQLKLALFDMDGLMVDSERACYNCWKQSLSAYGIDMTEEEYVTYTGHRYDEIRELFKSRHPDFLQFDEFEKDNDVIFMQTIDRGIPLKAGLVEMLDELDRLKIGKVIVSSSSNQHVARVLGPSGIQSRFLGVVGGQRVKHSKPQPDIFLLSCEEYDVKPEECVVFEDSMAGVMASYAAGIPVICVPDMKPLPKELEKECYAICPTLADAIPYIRSMVK